MDINIRPLMYKILNWLLHVAVKPRLFSTSPSKKAAIIVILVTIFFSLLISYVLHVFITINNKIEYIELKSESISKSLKNMKDHTSFLSMFIEISISNQLKDNIDIAELKSKIDLLQLNEKIPGIVLIENIKINQSSHTIKGKIDETSDTSWEQLSIEKIIKKIKEEIEQSELSQKNKKRIDIFFGAKRQYRNKEFYEKDGNKQKLGGSFVIASAFKHNRRWHAVLILHPLKYIRKLMRSEMDDYYTGSYDYIFDLHTGNVIMHPKKYHILGSNEQAVSVEGARELKQMGSMPMNIENLDWITRGYKFNKAYNQIRNDKEMQVVAYENLNGDCRLTSMRKFKVKKHLSDSVDHSLGIMSGYNSSCFENMVFDWFFSDFLDKKISLFQGIQISLSKLIIFLAILIAAIILFLWLVIIRIAIVYYIYLFHNNSKLSFGTASRVGLLPVIFSGGGIKRLDNMVILLIGGYLENVEPLIEVKIREGIEKFLCDHIERGWVNCFLSCDQVVLARELKADAYKTNITYDINYFINFLKNEQLFVENSSVTAIYVIGSIDIKVSKDKEFEHCWFTIEGEGIKKVLEIAKKYLGEKSLIGSIVFNQKELESVGLDCENAKKVIGSEEFRSMQFMQRSEKM